MEPVNIEIPKEIVSNFFEKCEDLIQETSNYLIYISQNRDLSISFCFFHQLSNQKSNFEIIYNTPLITVSIECPNKIIQKNSCFFITPSHPIVITFFQIEINHFISNASAETRFFITINNFHEPEQNNFCSFIQSLIIFWSKYDNFFYSDLIRNQFDQCRSSFPLLNSEEISNFYTTLASIHMKYQKAANSPFLESLFGFHHKSERPKNQSTFFPQLLKLMFSPSVNLGNQQKIELLIDNKMDTSDTIEIFNIYPQSQSMNDPQLLTFRDDFGFNPFYKKPTESTDIIIYIDKSLLQERNLTLVNVIRLDDQHSEVLIDFEFILNNHQIEHHTLYDILKDKTRRLRAFTQNKPQTIESDTFPFDFDLEVTVFVSIPIEKNICMERISDKKLKIELFDYISNNKSFGVKDNYLYFCADEKQTFFKMPMQEYTDILDILDIFVTFPYIKNNDNSLILESLPTFSINKIPNGVSISHKTVLNIIKTSINLNWCSKVKSNKKKS